MTAVGRSKSLLQCRTAPGDLERPAASIMSVFMSTFS
jgi:hypothetical protein